MAAIEKITFGMFADLHYKKGMYITSVNDVKDIFSETVKDGASFMVHLGDMCNDYVHSPEITKAFLENEQKLEAYGIYGNHELESAGNEMRFVTPLLTNQAEAVTWGTEDGKIGDGSIAYYYFDKGNFRFVATDTNYSLNVSTGEYEHNRPASWGAPAENAYHDSLGTEQLEWLRKTILDAAESGKHCIILSHENFCPEWQSSPDSDEVRAIFREANAIKEGTVILALNGHWHDNRQAESEGVTYIDVNTVRNGYWQYEKYFPYTEQDPSAPRYTFEYVDYDENGIPKGSEIRALESLRMSSRTLYFDTPLFATVTVSEDGRIKIKGRCANWIYGIKPDNIDIPDRLLGIDDFNS